MYTAIMYVFDSMLFLVPFLVLISVLCLTYIVAFYNFSSGLQNIFFLFWFLIILIEYQLISFCFLGYDRKKPTCTERNFSFYFYLLLCLYANILPRRPQPLALKYRREKSPPYLDFHFHLWKKMLRAGCPRIQNYGHYKKCKDVYSQSTNAVEIELGYAKLIWELSEELLGCLCNRSLLTSTFTTP